MLASLGRFKEILALAFDYKKALERENLKQESVDLLRVKLKHSKIVPQAVVDKQLLLFLNACKSDVDKCVLLVENYYKIKKSTPEFFSNRNVDSNDIQKCLKYQNYVALPITPDNNMLIFHSLRNFEASNYDFDAAAKTYIMTSEAYTYENGPRTGVVYLFDLKGVSFRYLFKPSINSMRKGVKFLEEANPCEIKAVHVFNTVYFFDLIIGLVKPLLNSELLQKLHLHRSDMDYEEFYRDHVPKSHLPSDYGGDLDSVENLHQNHVQKLMSLKDYFKFEEMQANFEFDSFVEEFLEEVNKI